MRLLVPIILAIALVAVHRVEADVIDFTGGIEGNSVGTINVPGNSVTFSSNTIYARQGGPHYAFSVNFLQPFVYDTGNSGSFAMTGNIFITDARGANDSPGVNNFPITVIFENLVSSVSFDVADIDRLPLIYGDYQEIFTATAFDATNTLVATVTKNGSPSGDGAVDHFSLTSPGGIKSVQFDVYNVYANQGAGVAIGIDNLEFQTISQQVVPEPAGLAIWSLLGLIGMASGYRRWQLQGAARDR